MHYTTDKLKELVQNNEVVEVDVSDKTYTLTEDTTTFEAREVMVESTDDSDLRFGSFFADAVDDHRIL